MREFPELYKQYFSKVAMPEPKNYEDEEQGQEEANRELEDEADFEWEDEEEGNDEWDEDDWDEFEVIERKDEF